MEISKPSLSWVLMSKASDLCQTLGWHRASILKSGEPEDVELKQFVFWAIYFLDKSLSLRLGRSSTIPDWDISVPPPGTSDANSQPLIDYFVLWIRSARCQGKIYELLYSPDATSQPEPVRQNRVQSLVREMEVLAQDIVVNDVSLVVPVRELTRLIIPHSVNTRHRRGSSSVPTSWISSSSPTRCCACRCSHLSTAPPRGSRAQRQPSITTASGPHARRWKSTKTAWWSCGRPTVFTSRPTSTGKSATDASPK